MTKKSTCNSFKDVNDCGCYKDVFIENEEVYNFKTSYFVTEPAYDENNNEEITNKFKK